MSGRIPRVQRRRNGSGKLAGTYSFRFVDPVSGRRRWVSLKTSDKRAAERMRDDYIARAEAIARGDVNPDAERLVCEAKKPVRDHVTDYVARCRVNGQDEKSVREKARHLDWFVSVCESFSTPWRLDGIRADVVDERLGALTEDGASARTVNLKIEAMRAFLRWCVQSGRLERDPLRVLRKRNEVTDRRHVHRVLTEAETEAVLAVARDSHDPRRALWYMLPLRAGLRRSDMVRLAWRDIDLAGRTLTVRGGKARHRVDVLPLCSELVEELCRLRPNHIIPAQRIFPSAVSNATRQADYKRAGIVLEKDHGVADLHSLRATFATRLAVRGTPPAKLQRLMRHTTPALTMKYYVHIEVDDLRDSVEVGSGSVDEPAEATS